MEFSDGHNCRRRFAVGCSTKMMLTLIFILALAQRITAWQAMPFSMDSEEDGYQMLIKHDPWWGFDNEDEGIGSSYQYYYPFFQRKKVPNTFSHRHHHRRKKPIRMKHPPIQPSPTMAPSMSTREWPSWIPPIRLIKLPLDEPPAALD